MAQLLYLYDHSKAARRILISGHPGQFSVLLLLNLMHQAHSSESAQPAPEQL